MYQFASERGDGFVYVTQEKFSIIEQYSNPDLLNGRMKHVKVYYHDAFVHWVKVVGKAVGEFQDYQNKKENQGLIPWHQPKRFADWGSQIVALYVDHTRKQESREI